VILPTEIYDILHSQDLIQWHLKISTMPLVSSQEVAVLFPKNKDKCDVLTFTFAMHV
jgi:hypothetical protein